MKDKVIKSFLDMPEFLPKNKISRDKLTNSGNMFLMMNIFCAITNLEKTSTGLSTKG